MMAFHPDLRVLAATGLAGVTAGLLMSALPVWAALRRPAQIQARSERTVAGTSGRRTIRGLLVAQVALSVVLVVGAGLLVRSLYLLQHADLGIRTQSILTVRVSPRAEGYAGIDAGSYYPRLVEQIAALPGVRAVGLDRVFPGPLGAQPIPVSLTGTPATGLTAHFEVAAAGFFHTLGIPLLAGRLPSWSDNANTRRVAVISESLARALAPHDRVGDLLEQRIRFGNFPPQELTIVGIVANATRGDPREIDPMVVYEAPLQFSATGLYPRLVVATSGGFGGTASGIRDVLRGGGYEYAETIVPLADVIARAPSDLRMSATVAGAIGGLAVLLALIGIYGALAYAVSRRTREIGVRVALGAAPASVARLVLGEGLLLTVLGVGIGLPLAFVAGQALRSLIFGITPADTLTFVAVSLFFLALALAAGFVPARRATKVDPAVTLRAD
jgi:predicted permease